MDCGFKKPRSTFYYLRSKLIMRLKRNFYNRPTITVAKELLGKYLVRKANKGVIRAKITETEAYCGTRDLACHASKGLTPRTKVMFGPPGYAYVYMIYGMYHCLNIVTEERGNPSAVLIRGAEICSKYYVLSIKGKNGNKKPIIHNTNPMIRKLSGPGILCRELKIDRKLNNADLIKNNKLWVEEGEKIKPSRIKKGKRIGVDYAGSYKDKLWRFYLIRTYAFGQFQGKIEH